MQTVGYLITQSNDFGLWGLSGIFLARSSCTWWFSVRSPGMSLLLTALSQGQSLFCHLEKKSLISLAYFASLRALCDTLCTQKCHWGASTV